MSISNENYNTLKQYFGFNRAPKIIKQSIYDGESIPMMEHNVVGTRSAYHKPVSASSNDAMRQHIGKFNSIEDEYIPAYDRSDPNHHRATPSHNTTFDPVGMDPYVSSLR